MLQLGTLKGFNSTDYRAEVQLAGSMAAYLDNIPVARNIASDQMTVGRHVILAIPQGNPKDACVVAVWDGAAGGGGPGGGASTFLDLTDTPASFAGQAGKYTKVNAAQNALEFGQALDDHHARHEWLGDDQLNTRLLLLWLTRYLSNDWRTMDGWANYITGSGSISWDSIVQIRLHTGAINNSHAAVYIGVGAGISPQMANRPILFHIQTDGAALTASEIRFYALQTGEAYPPGDISKHIGFKVINGEIYATNADGTTETATDTGVSMQPAYSVAMLGIIGDGSSIKYYVNDVLKATHTTNIPPNYNYRIWCGINNTAATDQRLRFHHVNIFTG